MRYQPTFCCNCGNRIERTKWHLWTSGRFCENCESSFWKEEWLPTVFLTITAIIGGLFGFGSYLKSPEKQLSITSARTPVAAAENSQNKNVRENSQPDSLKTVQPISANINQNGAVKTIPAFQNATKTESLQNAADDPVYFCGAQTKKGTPCSRKVKGGGRCWQHTGQPAMLPKDKLLAGS